MRVRITVIAALTVLLCGVVFLGKLTPRESRSFPIDDQKPLSTKASQLAQILTDQQLWGDDAFAVFGSLDRWKRGGEVSIIIYPDKVAAGTKSETPEGARRSVARMSAAMKRARLQLRPEYAASYREALATRAPALKVEFARFLEDDSFRVVWQREGGEFLKRDLKISSVFDTYGKPEKTTTEVVHSRGERRPAILTLHHYASGTVKFVESDLAPMPGLVDRVILDVATVAAQIFTDSR